MKEHRVKTAGKVYLETLKSSRLILPIETDTGLRDIANRLDGLPLALATAGSYLFQTSMTASKYLQHHNASWLELQRTSPQLLSYEDQTIYSTWNMSYIHIRKEDMSAAKLLELWAYFDNHDLWYDMLRSGTGEWAPAWFNHIIGSELAFEAAITKCKKHALVESLTDSDGYTMHHCVYAWAKSVLFKTIEDQTMRLALICIGNTVSSEITSQGVTIRQRLLPHSERCIKLLRGWDREGKNTRINEICIAQFYGVVPGLYYDRARVMEAESMSLRAFSILSKFYGLDSLDALDAALKLAVIYTAQRQFNKAEMIYKLALFGFEEKFGQDHEFTLSLTRRLGVFYRNLDRMKEARLCLQRALTGYEKAFGPNHYEVLKTAEDLGLLYYEEGKLKEAELMIQRALTADEDKYGPDDEHTLDAITNLGMVYQKQGRSKEADSLFKRALTGYETNFGRDCRYTLVSARHLGLFYVDIGKFMEAESMHQRVLTGYENLLGPDKLSTLNAVSDLGGLYGRQRKFTEAERSFLRFLRGYIRNPPRDLEEPLRLFYCMGVLYQDMQDFEKAREFLSQAYKGRRELLGSQHLGTIKALNALRELDEKIEQEKQGPRSLYRSRRSRRPYERRVIFPWRRRL